MGLPLQGDQPSNLNRIAELGMAKMIQINEIRKNYLGERLSEMIQNIDFYKRRAKNISSMVKSHRFFTTNQQTFWLNWAKKYGKKLKHSRSGGKLFNFFYRSSIDHFCLFDVVFYFTLFTGVVWILKSE